MQSSQVSK